MENIQNPTIQEKILPPEGKPKFNSINLLIILQTVIIILLAAILIYENRSYQPLIKQESENTEKKEDIETQKPSFVGKTFTAEVPTGWTLTEYYNGSGTENLADPSSYTGLTALIIKKGNKEIFSIKGADDFGYEECDPYAKFKDFSTSHLADAQKQYFNVTDDSLEILDYTKSPYSEINFIDKTFRRINSAYYYDTKEDNNYFEPSCIHTLLQIDGLSFSRADKSEVDTYFYGTSENATEEELTILDEILESIEFVK